MPASGVAANVAPWDLDDAAGAAMSPLRAAAPTGLPLGLHLIGRPFDEQGVLNAGLAIEARAGFAARADRWW